MAENGVQHLRILIANERRDRLRLLARVVVGLGHEVIAQEVEVTEAAAATAREEPDVALVGLGVSSDHALALIGEIVREAACPVIALLTVRDPAHVREAARRGVFAYIVDTTPEELQSAIDITLQRFAEYHSLLGTLGRRAVIEQAKAILMARRALDADQAFELLRVHSQHTGRQARRRGLSGRGKPRSPPGNPSLERSPARRRSRSLAAAVARGGPERRGA
jgi:AmiR/NasT family two-component response regulator